MEIKYRTELPSLLRHFNLPLIAVELGTAEGYSASDFMKEGLDKLYVVDLWEKIPGHPGDGGNPNEWHNKNYEVAKERLNPYGDKVIFLRGLTTDMASKIANNSISLVYVDADHSEQGVEKDCNAYWDKLIPGGIMAFHDFENTWDYGVKAAVTKFAAGKGLEIHLIPENKIEDAGAWIQKNQ